MRKEISISFIIPAYNAEKTLEKCVDSIIACDYSDIEVLIVENGSFDRTAMISQALGKKDSRVKLFHSEKGVSNARNMGIQKATGKWISFVDADDRIIPNRISELICDAKSEDADMILYGHCVQNKVKSVIEEREVYEKEKIEIIRDKMLKNPTKYMQVWAKLLKRDLIIANELTFNNKMRLAEDSDFILRYSKFCKKIVLSSICIYEYSLNPFSVMRTFDEEKKWDYIFAMKETSKLIEKESAQIQNAFDKYILMHMNILFVRETFNISNKIKYSEKISNMKVIVQNKIFKNALNRTKIVECMHVRMLPILLIKMHLLYFAGMIYLIRAWQNYKRESIA